jgi:hypothetical protein
MNPLSFLSQVTVAAVEAVKKPVTRVAKQYQPVTADLRIHASGAIYPSDALIAEFNLEYTDKGSDAPSFGMDVIDVAQMPAIQSPERFLAVSFVPKSAPKVDLFGMTKFSEDGTPMTKVGEQGSATFGKETLLPLLAEVYAAVPNEEGFIDLNILRDMPFTSPNGIFMFPKTVSRGEKKGEISYTRRENQTVYALIAVTPEGAPAPEEEAQPVTEEPAVAPEGEFDFTQTGMHADDHSAELVDPAAPVATEAIIEAEANPFSNNETPVFTPLTSTPRTA